MKEEIFFNKIKDLADLRKGNRVLHLFNNKTIFSDMLLTAVGNTGHIYAINVNALTNKTPKENISFHTIHDNLELNSETLDLIIIEKTLFKIKNLRKTLREIKKYLTSKGKIIIYQEKKVFSFFQSAKQIHESMFLAGFKLKNKFNLRYHFLEIYQQE